MKTERETAIDILLDEQEGLYLERTPQSLNHLRQSVDQLPLGVATSLHSHYPYSLVISHGEGSYVYDHDGNRYLDFNQGFGTNVFGHAHPLIAEAIETQVKRGTHYGAPLPMLLEYADNICQRVGMEQIRFNNSGTEATMDAIRIARAYTGRDKVLKMEGSYHGHHDIALLSIKPDPELAGDARKPQVVPNSEGIPQAIQDMVTLMPFNDIEAFHELENPDAYACLMVEPVLCNLGMIVPQPGYLEFLRDWCDEHGVVLIFDQVKTGLTIGYGGAIDHWEVQPDLHTLGKAIGGGVPVGALGGKRSIMECISEWKTPHYGTFSGNALTVAAGHTAVCSVLVPETYEYLQTMCDSITGKCRDIYQRHQLPFHAVSLCAKGGVFFSSDPPHNYREWYDTVEKPLSQLYWIYMANRGIWMAPGADEQWTLPCTIEEDDIDIFIQVFDSFCGYISQLPR